MENKVVTEKITVDNIVSGEKDFFALNFEVAADRDIAMRCLDRMPLFALRMKVDNPSHLDLLKMWIKKRYENLFILTPEQRCVDLVNIYLEEKFKEQLASKVNADPFLNKSVSLLHSYNKELVINYHYQTKEGEIVSYFDNALNIPIKLNTDASTKFKLIDGLKLVKNIDIELNYMDIHTLVNLLNGLILESLRSSLLGVIAEQNVSYYDLPRNLDAVKEAMLERLEASTAKYGLQIADLTLNDVSLIDRIDVQLEKQYYALAKMRQVKQYEYSLEEESLRLYEKKASIHANYPDFEVGLTEAEKDFALERYLKRKDKATNLAANVSTQKTAGRLEEHAKTATTVAIAKPKAPTPLVKKNTARIVFAIGSALWLVAVILLFVLDVGLSIAIPVTIVGAAIIAASAYGYRYQLRYGVSEKEKKDYDRARRAYEKLLSEYNAYQDGGVTPNTPAVNEVFAPTPAPAAAAATVAPTAPVEENNAEASEPAEEPQEDEPTDTTVD